MSVSIGIDLARAESLLRRGELVAIPTETVYGLAANAQDPDAVLRIFEAKERPHFDPLIVHVASLSQAESLVADFPALAMHLAERFWPGPLTLVLPKRSTVPDLVTSGSQLVALRMPNHPLTLELQRRLPFALAAPSANRFGGISPTQPQHVADSLSERVAYILDGGPCSVGIESTIVGVGLTATGQDELRVYRWGGLDLDTLLAAAPHATWRMAERPQDASPGNLPGHYAPHTPLILGAPPQDADPGRTGIILFAPTYDFTEDWPYRRVLAPDGEPHTAAQNLFATLHELDAEGQAAELDIIYAQLAPESGLGRAINDRLRRAAAAHVF